MYDFPTSLRGRIVADDLTVVAVLLSLTTLALELTTDMRKPSLSLRIAFDGK